MPDATDCEGDVAPSPNNHSFTIRAISSGLCLARLETKRTGVSAIAPLHADDDQILTDPHRYSACISHRRVQRTAIDAVDHSPP